MSRSGAFLFFRRGFIRLIVVFHLLTSGCGWGLSFGIKVKLTVTSSDSSHDQDLLCCAGKIQACFPTGELFTVCLGAI